MLEDLDFTFFITLLGAIPASILGMYASSCLKRVKWLDTPTFSKNETLLSLFLETFSIYSFYDFFLTRDNPSLSKLFKMRYEALKNSNSAEKARSEESIESFIQQAVSSDMLDTYKPAQIIYKMINILVKEQDEEYLRIQPKSFKLSDLSSGNIMHRQQVHKVLVFKGLVHQGFIVLKSNTNDSEAKHVLKKQLFGPLKETIQETYDAIIKERNSEILPNSDDKVLMDYDPLYTLVYFDKNTFLPANIDPRRFIGLDGPRPFNSFTTEINGSSYTITTLLFYDPGTDNWAFVSKETKKFIVAKEEKGLTTEKIFSTWNVCFAFLSAFQVF